MQLRITALSAKPAALIITLGIAGASWIVAVRQMNGMDMGVSTRLGSFAFFDVHIPPDPLQQRSIRSPNRFGATEEPPVPSFGVTHTKTHFTGATRT